MSAAGLASAGFVLVLLGFASLLVFVERSALESSRAGYAAGGFLGAGSALLWAALAVEVWT